jgi:hypothetical protein
MDQASELKLMELRFWTPEFFDPQIARRLKIMLDRLSRAYLSYLEIPLKFKNTNVILYSVINLDYSKLNKRDREQFYSLGNLNDYIGGSSLLIAEKKLLDLHDEDRRKFLVDEIHLSLKNYVIHTNSGSVEELDRAHKSLINANYFSGYSKVYASGKITCQIESRENFGSADYRLSVKAHETGEVKAYDIARKDYPFFDEMSGITQHDILDYPQTFNPIKWEGKNFVMYWGKEKYIFDPETKRILME